MEISIAWLLMAITALAREYSIEIIRVVDGDTVIANVDLGMGVTLVSQSIRLSNANAPEKNTPEGKVSMGWLEVAISSSKKAVLITDRHEREKYGRIIGRIMLDGVDIGEKSKSEHYSKGGPGRKG